MPTKYIDVNGTAVQYFHAGPTTLPEVVPDLGRGELLVFVHGAGSNGHTWHHQVDALAANHSPVSFDFPGHGRSGGTESRKSIEAYRDFLIAFMDVLRTRPAVVIGHDMGGAVALELALMQSGCVRALVLVNTAARFELPAQMLDVWENVMRGRAQQPFTTEAFSAKTEFAVMREIWTEQVKTDPRVRYFDLVACNEFDARNRLAGIAMPTLIVAGRDDVVTPLAQAEELHRGIAGSRLVVIDDAGHALSMEKPAALSAAIATFIEALG